MELNYQLDLREINRMLKRTLLYFVLKSPLGDLGVKKNRASYSYRTAQPSTFAAFLPWRIEQELVV